MRRSFDAEVVPGFALSFEMCRKVNSAHRKDASSASIRVGWWIILERSVAARSKPDGAAHLLLDVPFIS